MHVIIKSYMHIKKVISSGYPAVFHSGSKSIWLCIFICVHSVMPQTVPGLLADCWSLCMLQSLTEPGHMAEYVAATKQYQAIIQIIFILNLLCSQVDQL